MASSAPAHEQSVEDKIFRCWMDGMGMRPTIEAVERMCGERLTFEQVRSRFAALAERFHRAQIQPPPNSPKLIAGTAIQKRNPSSLAAAEQQ